MALGFGLCVSFLLLMVVTISCDVSLNGALRRECHDRFFMITIDLSITGDEIEFEAIDGIGVYPITEEYAAKCGYTIRVLPLQRLAELRASYLSCHTDNQGDEMFTFRFNLISTHDGLRRTYTLDENCSVALPWAYRELACESNYMEVSLMTDVTCVNVTRSEDWDSAFDTAYSSATPELQLMFKKDGMLTHKNFSEAAAEGYLFKVTDNRVLFRTPYGQPDSFRTEVNGVPVEAVHPLLFARHFLAVVIMEVVAACSVYETSYSQSGHILWEIPSVWHPLFYSLQRTRTSLGVNGVLEESQVAREKGYMVEEDGSVVRIGIPYNAEGGHRKSLALGEMVESYAFELYLEQVSATDNNTRLRVHKTLISPLLQRPLLFENRTDPEEHSFTVFLGDLPADVTLAAVTLNGVELLLPLENGSRYTLTEESKDGSHGYVLKVPLGDPVVTRQLYRENAMMHFRLNINYTLVVMPERRPFYQVGSVELLMDVVPPEFTASCSESGISFSVRRQPFDYLWRLAVGSDLLTPELALQRGYNLSRNDQSLQLYVPMFSHGFTFQDVTLRGFAGKFEILVLDAETMEVQRVTAKTCSFTASEFILCSTNGTMTFVVDLSAMVLGEGEGAPGRTSLLDSSCRPEDSDDSRALFSIPINSCSSQAKVEEGLVKYENEVLFGRSSANYSGTESGSEANSVTVQCAYPLSSLDSFFSTHRFESDTAGIGAILHSVPLLNTSDPEAGPITTVQPTTVQPTTVPRVKLIRYVLYHSNQSTRYVMMNNFMQRRFPSKDYRQAKIIL